MENKIPEIHGEHNLIILGCGGHARTIANAAAATGYKNLYFVDSAARPGEVMLGWPVLDATSAMELPGTAAIAASGNPGLRAHQLECIEKAKLRLVSIIAPTAIVGLEARISGGVFVGFGAYVGPRAVLEQGCIINTSAVVEHDARIGTLTHISVNATVAGSVRIGQRCFVGAGATVIDGLEISDDVTIGAGATVVKHLKQPGVYLGCPARPG